MDLVLTLSPPLDPLTSRRAQQDPPPGSTRGTLAASSHQRRPIRANHPVPAQGTQTLPPPLTAGERAIIRARAPPRKTRAAIKIASLNMRGRFHNGTDKWYHINQILRTRRIGILCLQETHLPSEAVDALHATFGKRMHIITSADPTNPTATGGVTIVVNKDLANITGTQIYELIPGRALMASIPWHRNKTLTVLNVYAPTDNQQNALFWEELNTNRHGRPHPDAILGDFNLVEDALDRLPPHRDPPAPTENLSEILTALNMTDGWRETNPDTLQYTYSQSIRQGASHSRIDRIYVRRDGLKFSNSWDFSTPGIPTDHQMVSVQLTDAALPFIGKGRWVFPSHLINNKKAMHDLTSLCRKAEATLKEITVRTEAHNAQTIFEKLKLDIQDLAILESRRASSKLDEEIKNLEKERNSTNNNQTRSVEARQVTTALLQERIKVLADAKHRKARDELAAKYRIESECASSGFWAKTGKDRPPRDTIIELRAPNSDPPTYEKRSDRMAEITRNYHDQLQTKDRTVDNEADINQALEFVACRLNPQQQQLLGKQITREEVAATIKGLPNGKAAGMNGIPYEFWKHLLTQHDTRINM